MSNNPVPRATWILSYGDMVTLLLTFFLMMIVVLNEAENTIYQMVDVLLNETQQNLNNYVRVEKLNKNITVNRTTKGVQLTISGEYFFDVNSAEISENLRPILDHIGNTIRHSRMFALEEDAEMKSFYEAMKKYNHVLNVEIRVEGHTDNWAIRGGKYAGNWELSSARALEVVRYLSEVSGIEESKFSALGYGEFRPVADNSTEEGRTLNRRVEIFIDADLQEIQPKKAGL
ncbi:MAG: flagellar motor protein MotB [Candidatus Marinimicrobia bacterium]|nr:flagellar motor protein MotB [Candidatus Neomarinimicrobiota bacterium]